MAEKVKLHINMTEFCLGLTNERLLNHMSFYSQRYEEINNGYSEIREVPFFLLQRIFFSSIKIFSRIFGRKFKKYILDIFLYFNLQKYKLEDSS